MSIAVPKKKNGLNQKQREEIAYQLISLQIGSSSSVIEASKKLLKNIRFDRPGIGSNDLADATHEIPVLESRKSARSIEQLRKINAALERMDSGKFGFCIDCEFEIPFERLLAEPTAIRCVPCAKKIEIKKANQNGQSSRRPISESEDTFRPLEA